MEATRPVRALFANLIDYAGLFPPAGLDMPRAVRNYADYLAGFENWILGRFVVPRARLEEFETAAKPYFEQDCPWRLSLLGPGDYGANGLPWVIDSVETKPERIEDIRPASVTTYYEIPSADPAGWIDAIAKAGGRAKIRTGGVTPDAFPPSAQIAHFMLLCHQAKVPFKATAGLHHAVRGNHNFTWEPGSACGVMYGFLNVFLAAALTYSGFSEHVAIRMLEEDSARTFHFHDDGIRWHSHWLSPEQIQATRQEFAVSFGSCSFEEPIQDLKTLRLL